MRPRSLLTLACAALAACTSLAPGYSDVALENLFNAEREFAADTYARGIRASFIAHFAPDAIVFQPGPIRYADLIKGRPAPADPTAVRLEWGPQAGAVSRDGDLGYTTGPSRASERDNPAATPTYGYYFSVWARTHDGWKVVVDAGIAQSTPPPQEGVPNMRSPIVFHAPAPVSDAQRSAHRDALLDMERVPRTLGEPVAGTRPYAELITGSTRVLRDGRPMLTGAALADAVAAGAARRVEWTPIDGAIAQSDDLAYTYGVRRETAAGGAIVDGYYVHVWQRDPGGSWKLAADVTLAPATVR